MFPVFVSPLLYFMYFINVVSWSHVVGRDHSSSGVQKEKAQKSDTSEAQRAWLEKGHHMEPVPAVPGQKLGLQSGAEGQLSQGMGTNGKGPEKTLHVLLVRKALSETVCLQRHSR